MTAHSPQIIEPDQTAIVEFWNEVLAPKFLQYQHVLVGGLSRHSAAVLPALDIAPGARVLDVGCGFGDTAIALAERVGSAGHVTGVDCCQAFLDIAQKSAEENSVTNISFVEGDAERGLEETNADFVFARFGTMFFTNPVAGLRAMRKALKPGGKMAHIVWRHREDNPWLSAAGETVRGFLPAPGEDARTCGPGPFSMSDEVSTRAKMEAAGFVDVAFKRFDTKVLVGRTVQDAINFQLALGPAGETFREAGPLAEEKRPEIEAALAEVFCGLEETEEGLWMNSSSWLITARAPKTT